MKLKFTGIITHKENHIYAQFKGTGEEDREVNLALSVPEGIDSTELEDSIFTLLADVVEAEKENRITYVGY